MTKVLVSDPIDQAGIDILSQVAQVDVRTGLAPADLKAIIGEYDALMIRSGTQVTADVIEVADRLRIIGRAGVGVDNVDVPAATRRGVLVVNSPEGNTIAAAEHALALMLSLSRHVPHAHASTMAGGWDRKTYVGNELYKKTLGVVGLGKIGSHVARVGRAMGMDVVAYDPFVLPERAQQMQVRLLPLAQLFTEADYISLHLPRTPDVLELLKPHLQLADTLGQLLSQLTGGQLSELEVRLQGDFAQHPAQPLVVAALKGVLSTALGDSINFVNATLEAKERGIHVLEVKDDASRDFAGGSLQLTARTPRGNHSVTGAVFADGELRVVTIDEFPVNVAPSRHMLFTRHRDMPGIIGHLGSLLGEHNVNIASMQVGRRIVRGDAVMVLSLDDPLPPSLLSDVHAINGIQEAHPVTL
jgi:hypothetical protein